MSDVWLLVKILDSHSDLSQRQDFLSMSLNPFKFFPRVCDKLLGRRIDKLHRMTIYESNGKKMQGCEVGMAESYSMSVIPR